jgi:tol-pal system protein YbgF
MLALLCCSLSAVSAVSASCATTPDPVPAAQAAIADPRDAELTRLRTRVQVLERRLTDVDTQLALLAPGGGRNQAMAQLRPSVDIEPQLDRGETVELFRGEREQPVYERGQVRNVPQMNDGDVDNSNLPPVVLRLRGTPDPVRTAAQHPDTTGASDVYQQAQALLQAGQLAEAEKAFASLLTTHPNHDLADNALYWLSKCKQDLGDHKGAIASWSRLPQRFPRSPKVPDALFGMATSHEALGEPVLAEVLYDQLVSSYPKAERVVEAKKSLHRLRPNP